LIGEVAARSGVSRKALRLYESTGILSAPARTPSGYRVYGEEALRVLSFVTQARRLGLSLAEIKEIVALKRSGTLPCQHVQRLVRRKAEELDRKLRDLAAVRRRLRSLLATWRSRRGAAAAVCPHIERANRQHEGR
jgi:DNA-binding transcriptional MerR regulator